MLSHWKGSEASEFIITAKRPEKRNEE
jgi:hypothetical protein